MNKILRFFYIGVFALFSGCISLVEPNLSTPILDWEKLFIDESDLPDGWEKAGISEGCISAPLMSGCENRQEKYVTYFYGEISRFLVEIHYYKDSQSLLDDYQTRHTLAFPEYQDNNNEYLKPDEVEFDFNISEGADFGCIIFEYDTGNIESCRYIGQYGQFLVRVSTWFEEKTNYDLIQEVLVAVDNKMSIYEDNPPIISLEP